MKTRHIVQQIALVVSFGIAASAQAQLLGGGRLGGSLGGSMGGMIGGAGQLGGMGGMVTRGADLGEVRNAARTVRSDEAAKRVSGDAGAAHGPGATAPAGIAKDGLSTVAAPAMPVKALASDSADAKGVAQEMAGSAGASRSASLPQSSVSASGSAAGNGEATPDGSVDGLRGLGTAASGASRGVAAPVRQGTTAQAQSTRAWAASSAANAKATSRAASHGAAAGAKQVAAATSTIGASGSLHASGSGAAGGSASAGK
jgi:hypothetical protein